MQINQLRISQWVKISKKKSHSFQKLNFTTKFIFEFSRQNSYKNGTFLSIFLPTVQFFRISQWGKISQKSLFFSEILKSLNFRAKN